MDKVFYPAIFHEAEEGGFWITFPDFPECLSEGDDMSQAYHMAVEALGLAITSREQEKEEIPEPSDFRQLSVSEKEKIVIVEFDMLADSKRTKSKAVKKTLSIPEWLNEAACNAGLNFSQILQEALIVKLHSK